MARRITKTLLDGLAASGETATGTRKRLVIFDTEVRGFGVRVTPAGTKTFFVDYRLGGGRASPKKRFVIGQLGAPWTADTARQEAKRILHEVAGGIDPATKREEARARATARTVADMCAEWLSKDQAGNRTAAEVRRAMENDVLPHLGKITARELTRADILDVIDRKAAVAPVRANRLLAYVKRMTRWAASRDMLDVDPAATILRPTRESSRERVLADDELAAIWRALDAVHPVFAAGVRLLALTGARREEIFNARWSEYDRKAAVLRLPPERTKAEAGRALPLVSRAVEIIDERPQLNAFIFTTGRAARKGEADERHLGTAWANFGHAKRGLDEVIATDRRDQAEPRRKGEPLAPADLKRYALPNWRLHDIRRTVATNCQRLGVRLEVTENLLGHVSGSRAGVIGVYQRHQFEAETREAAELWARALSEIVDGPPAASAPRPGNVVALPRR